MVKYHGKISMSHHVCALITSLHVGAYVCLLHPPELVIVPQVEAKHVVKVLTAQLGLGVQGDVAGLVDGVTFHPLLALDPVEAGDLCVPANQDQKFFNVNNS